MDLESDSKEKIEPKSFRTIEENLNFPIIVNKDKNIAENDNNSQFLRKEEDSKDLELVHNYAQKIKSFLGWESMLEEKEQKLDQDELGKNPVGENACKNLDVSFPIKKYFDEREAFIKENIDSAKVLLDNQEEQYENTFDSLQSKSTITNMPADKIENDLIAKDKKGASETENNDKNEEYMMHSIENVETNTENKSITNKLTENEKDQMENNNIIITNFEDIGTMNSYKNDVLIVEPKSEAANVLNQYTKFDNCAPMTEDKVHVEISNSTSLIPLLSKQITDYTKQENHKSENTENKTEIIKSVKEKLDPYCSSALITEILPDEDEKINMNSIYKDENNINLISEIDSLKKENGKKMSELIIENMDEIDLERDSSDEILRDHEASVSEVGSSGSLRSNIKNNNSADMEKEESSNMEEKTNCDVKINKNNDVDGVRSPDSLDSEVNNYSSIKIEENKNNDADDAKSEDSLDFDENFTLRDDLPKQYIKSIRRFSRDIVKEVMESARNSVHEIGANTLEDLDITFLSESLKSDLLKDSHEFHLNYYDEKHAKVTSTVKVSEISKQERISPSKPNRNFNRAKCQLEQELCCTGDDDNICGCACFRPRWIQNYATPRIYLTLFSIIGIVHGCYYTYIVTIMSTLEKRYAFKSKISGTILLADEIAPLFLGVLVGYIGGKTHRPRMIALGMLTAGVCYFIYGLPYFIYGHKTRFSNFEVMNKTSIHICSSTSKNTQCDFDGSSPTKTAVGIFILASFLKGFASVTYYVLGISYMDDIIKRKNSSLYLAIALALRLLGPLVGFLMSSGFLKYYENPLYDPGFGPDDPRWIGAWWIGFFLQGILLVIFTIPIALFPRRLPSQKKIVKVEVAASEGGLKNIFKGLISALKRLAKNPVFIVLIVNTTMKIFGHFGHAIMLPKYMENQFRLSASEASLYSGAISIVCIIISTLLGGFLIWKFTPRIKIVLGGMIVSEIILCIGYLILMVPRCQTSEMLHFGMDEEGLILNSICNRNCDCSTSSFTPFCGSDGKTLYFSPCYAGCTEDVTSAMSHKMNKEFTNCSCVDQQLSEATISEGFCPDENCQSQMTAYLIILFFLVTVSNLFTVAATMILLRSVHPSDKSVALGTFETFICLLGFIPFPVTYGALVDSACLVWEKSCGETGNCWFYDMEKYNYLLHGTSALFCSLSVVCLITLYFLSPRVRNLYVEENEDAEDETKYVDIKLDTVSGSVTKL